MMKIILMYLFMATAFAIQVIGQTNWTKHPDNPIFKGLAGAWDEHWVHSPTIIIDEDNTYHMWYSGIRTGLGGARTGYAYSTDGGINWTRLPNPVLQNGPPGSWDASTAFQPSVLYDGTIYHMWYSGHPGLYTPQIGYATSLDGLTWEKDTLNPVLKPGPAGDWDDYSIDAPDVLYIEPLFHMWYAGSNGTITQIGHATSADRVIWEKDTLNPVLTPWTNGEWDDPRVDLPKVLYDGYTFHLWYGGGDVYNWKTGYAYSKDGRNWIKVSVDSPVIPLGNSGEWDDKFNAGGMEVIFDADSNKLKMWYGGGRFNSFGQIGYATAPFVPVPVPVELTSFTVTTNGKEVILNWSTATELNNHGFEIQRSAEGKEFFTIGFVSGHGTISEHQNYLFADKNLKNGMYHYRLKQVDFDGSYEYSDVLEVELITLNKFLLEQNYPNPFNPTTKITYQIPIASLVSIRIFNALGEVVATLFNEEKPAGNYAVEFNAANLPSGIYFYRLQAGNFVEMKKMLLLK